MAVTNPTPTALASPAAAVPAPTKPPKPSLPGSKATANVGGAGISHVNGSNPNPALSPPSVVGGGSPPGALGSSMSKQAERMTMQHFNVNELVHQAMLGGLAQAKVAEDHCDDDKKDKKKDKEQDHEKEEKKASVQSARELASLSVKVASLLKRAGADESRASLPVSSIAGIGGKAPTDLGAGKQQPKDLKSLPGSRDLPTMDVAQPGTTNASKLAGRKRANETAASIPTMDVGDGPRGGMIPTSAPSVVGSNERIINATKADGSPMKRKELGEAFREPALTSSTDKVLSAAFNNTPGNKLASAQALFARLQREATK